MIYTYIKNTFLLACCLFGTLQTRAQSFDDLSPIQQEKVKLFWPSWTHIARVAINDSLVSMGQVLFPTDSGIVWRSVPQYLSYADTNIQFLPYRDITSLQINRSPRLGRHIINGGLIGSVIAVTGTFAGKHLFRTRKASTWGFQSGLGFLGGMASGLITGIIIDKAREQQTLYYPNAKNIWRLTISNNLMYSRKKENFWRKHWIENDSLITGVALPPELDKLKPYYYNQRLKISGFLGMASEEEPIFSVQNANLTNYGNMYRLAPRYFELRVAYQLIPWLKIGALVNKTNTSSDYLEMYHLNGDLGSYSSGNYRLGFHRTFGVFVEYTPFPVRYLAFRKWELNLGAGLLRESGTVSKSISLYYTLPNNENFEASAWNIDQFAHFGALTYFGFSHHLSQSLSLQAQWGYYFFKKHQTNSFSLDIIDPYKDVIFNPQTVKLSRSYLSFGTTIRL